MIKTSREFPLAVDIQNAMKLGSWVSGTEHSGCGAKF